MYSNVFGQTILSVHSNGTQQWADYYRYDAAGRMVLHASPSAVSGFDESLVDLVGYNAGTGTATYLRDGTSNSDQGLIELYVYGTTDTATETAASDAPGYLEATYVVKGDSGGLNTPPTGAVKTGALTYFKRSGGGAIVYPVATAVQYRNADGTGAETTSFAYTYFTGTTRIKSQTTSLPVVTTAQNGSNTAVTESTLFDRYGRAVWVVDGAGYITYNKFDEATGAIVKQISDVNPTTVTDAPSEVTAPTRATGLATALNLVTAIVVDNQGRGTKVTDANGNVTFSVYSDPGHSVRVYPGWNATTGTTTGPITLVREDRVAGFTETLISSATPATSGSAGSYVPTGTETITAANIQLLRRNGVDAAGQVVTSDQYTSLSGATYTGGTLSGGTYLRTALGYDYRGRLARTTAADGTFGQTVYDDLGRVASVWKGTKNAGATTTDPSNGGGFANNMVKVAGYVYDAGSVGDSELTQARTYYDATNFYATDYRYDFRDRLTAMRGADNVAAEYTLDNLGAATTVKTYADANTNFAIDSAETRGQTVTAFDEWGRAYDQKSYRVDPASGVVDHYLTSDYWYDQRGFLVKSSSASGVLSKATYDGAGRLTRQAMSIDPAESSYADALTLGGDQVIEQTDLYLDAGGRTRIATKFSRNADESTTLTGPLTSYDSYYMATGYWYDAANRVIATADYGQDGSENSGNATSGTRFVWQSSGAYKDTNSNGVPDVAEAAVPTAWTSANETNYTYILGKYEYDDAGRLKFSYDNKSRKTFTQYDLAGRVTKTVENYVDGVATASERDQDRVMSYNYDAGGNLTSLVATDANGSTLTDQTTVYVYASPIDRSWVTNTIYPDSSDLVVFGKGGSITVTGSDHLTTTYDRLGRVATSTDQRGVVHTYGYDTAGRLSSDSIGTGTLPSGVDGLVRTIAYGYDDLSRIQTVSSKDIAGVTLNQVKYTYDGWGNVIKDQQEHAGAVTGTTPATEYVYEEGETGNVAQYVRLRNVKYSKHDDSVGVGAGSIQYNYDSTGIGAALSRVSGITTGLSGGSGLVTYRYIGAWQKINQTFHPGIGGGLILNNGDDSSNYGGFDRFGRQRKVQWQTTNGATNFEQRSYTYDRTGNRLTMDNNGSDGGGSNYDETYGYDNLDRLIDWKRGTLSSGTLTSIKATQAWTLDSLGNWTTFVEDKDGAGSGVAVTQTRTFNAVNEITGNTNSSGGNWASAGYDASGNLTAGPKGGGSETTALVMKYDGWNRFAGIDSNADGDFDDAGEVRYAYDGFGQRIAKDFAGGTTEDLDYYYNESWQVLEVRKGGNSNPLERYVWDEMYIDAPLTIERDTNTDGTRDQRLWATYDSNFDVTAMLTDSGKVVERYAYTPYGTRTVLNGSSNYAGTGADPDGAAWTADGSGDDYDVKPGHQGLMWDAETGQWQNRIRQTHSSLGIFIQRDPLEYIDTSNFYLELKANPTGFVDPIGLRVAAPENGPNEKPRVMTDATKKLIEKLADPQATRSAEKSLGADKFA